jgi:hypothetical protein
MDPDEGLAQLKGPAAAKVWMLLVVASAVKLAPSPVNPAAINDEIAG